MKTHAFLIAGAAALLAAASAQAQSNATPTAAETQAARASGPCSDPWVTIALTRYYFSANPARCGVGLYANGSWGSFQQLYAAVGERDRALKAANLDLRVVPISGTNRTAVGVFSMVAAGGGNIVAAGGGNLVAAGGGNLVSPGGGSMVAAGGGNLTAVGPGEVVIRNGQLVLASSVRSLMSAGDVQRATVPVASSAGALTSLRP